MKDANQSIRNEERIKSLFQWRHDVTKKLDRIETVQRVEITTLFVSIATVLIKTFA